MEEAERRYLNMVIVVLEEVLIQTRKCWLMSDQDRNRTRYCERSLWDGVELAEQRQRLLARVSGWDFTFEKTLKRAIFHAALEEVVRWICKQPHFFPRLRRRWIVFLILPICATDTSALAYLRRLEWIASLKISCYRWQGRVGNVC